MTEKNAMDMANKHNLESAIKCLKRRASSFAEAAETINRRIDDIEQMQKNLSEHNGDRLASTADLFNWTINDIENVIRNLNFAEMARIGARL